MKCLLQVELLVAASTAKKEVRDMKMEKRKSMIVAMGFIAALFTSSAGASTFTFSFAGAGVSGTVNLTYGSATDAKYSHAYEVTGISGTFTDTNNGLSIVNQAIGPLVTVNHSTPTPTNLLAPADFSKFTVAAGLPAQSGGALTYDNLFYPGGSPQTANDYALHGGFLDIYGLMFSVGGGRVLDFWSNGDLTGSGTGPIDYGYVLATSATALDGVSGGVVITPEPGSLCLCGVGLLLALHEWRRRK